MAANSPNNPGKYTSAELLASAGAADPTTGARELVATVAPLTSEHTVAVELPWADAAAWAEERTSTLARASVRTTISATRLAEDLAGIEGQGDPGLRKDPVDLDLPPWQRGRYGTAVGRAVHGVLQFADLEHGSDIDRLADAQCAAEGILGVSETVAALARSALEAPIVRSTREHEHHRELFVAAEIDGRVLEGYIDLLVRTPDGSGHRRLQDRPVDRHGRCATNESAATAGNWRPTAWRSSGCSANRWSAVCSSAAVSARPPRRSRSTTGAARSRRSSAPSLVALGASTRVTYDRPDRRGAVR